MAVLVKELLKNYYINDIDTKLDLDGAIKNFESCGEFDTNDKKIIDLIKEQYTPLEIAFKLNISVSTVHRKRGMICSKISKRLGISYQDYKIILQVQQKLDRNLTDDERRFCWYIINRFGYKHDNKLSIYNFKIVDNKIVVGYD